ncbi:DUF2871 domain-containing protein [Amycolatopsis sp. FU40]|uniref:DUF2871 domain-containing protein n=1 Tax=Amycolatopsis sp. FU40 TaxID=2914159 RepID=UPI001F377B9C|nr:DUF2871 domain-containing protein [Amycolatopsis sp. FU40]UKD56048.1 DUF2871 domain-containing protein [Amycolatopsis sp. FU40]
MTKKIYWAAAIYTILGLLGGLYYRELTKAKDFTGDTQLSIVHTHLLALGTLVFLIVLVLDKVFTLSATRSFAPFFWIYHAGMLVTVGGMVVHGTLTVLGKESGAAIAGIAGLGHILLTVAFVLLFVGLHARIWKPAETKA